MSHFDDIIRAKLDGLRLDGTPDWNALQQRLDEEAFDEHLRAALPSGLFSAAAFGDETPASQWDALAERLDADTALEDDAFDRLIAQRLSRVESTLEPAESWTQLSRRMDTLWPLRRVLVRYRAPELAAAALLLFTFLPLLRDNATLNGWIGNAPTEVAFGAGESSGANGRAGGAGFGESRRDGEEGASGEASTVGVPGVLSPGEIAALLAQRDAYPGRSSAATPTRNPLQSSLSALAEVWQRLTLPSPQASTAALSDLRLESATTTDGEARGATLTELPLGREVLTPIVPAVPKLSLPKGFNPRSDWQYGVSGGLSVVHVVTPADNDFEVARRIQKLVVPQIGMQASYALRPQLRLGLSASILSVGYDPGLPEVTRARDRFSRNSGYTEDFRNISVDLLRTSSDIHLALRQPNRRVQVWAKAGVGTQLALRTNYDIQRAPANSGEQGVPFANPELPSQQTGFGQPQARPQSPIVRSSTPSDVKDLSNGILQGGSLRDNRQFLGRLGAEIEWKASDRLRVFGAVDLDAALPGQRGFGPNRDRFYSVTTGVGARVSL